MGSFTYSDKMFKSLASVFLGLAALVSAENWVNICEESSGNRCCAKDDTGMGSESGARHLYWIMKQPGNWVDLDLICRTERNGARLAVFESKRENDCVAKYLIKEFEDTTAKDYAIGLSTDSEYPGVYEWNRITGAELTADANAEALSFDNWANSAPSGLGCAVMTAGADDPRNGRWTDVDCSATATYYGICEYDGSS